MAACRFVQARQMERKPGVGPEDLRGLDDAFRAVHCIGMQPGFLVADHGVSDAVLESLQNQVPFLNAHCLKRNRRQHVHPLPESFSRCAIRL